MNILPLPCLEKLDNQSGLTAFQYSKMGPGRAFFDIVVVKASIDIHVDGIGRTERPGKLSFSDTHRDPTDQGGSSLSEAGDLILGKPGTDIYFSGNVEIDQPYKRFAVGVRVGAVDAPILNYECVATGARRWQGDCMKEIAKFVLATKFDLKLLQI